MKNTIHTTLTGGDGLRKISRLLFAIYWCMQCIDVFSFSGVD